MNNHDTLASKVASCNAKKMVILGILRQLRDQLQAVGKGFVASSEGKHFLAKVDIAIKALTSTTTPKCDPDTDANVPARGVTHKADMAKLDSLLTELRTCEELLDLGK